MSISRKDIKHKPKGLKVSAKEFQAMTGLRPDDPEFHIQIGEPVEWALPGIGERTKQGILIGLCNGSDNIRAKYPTLEFDTSVKDSVYKWSVRLIIQGHDGLIYVPTPGSVHRLRTREIPVNTTKKETRKYLRRPGP